jgi:hypothetical protein
MASIQVSSSADSARFEDVPLLRHEKAEVEVRSSPVVEVRQRTRLFVVHRCISRSTAKEKGSSCRSVCTKICPTSAEADSSVALSFL